ncbi:hypothetical protein ABPG72_019938 [Tetrahymena utriculariae]
MEKTLKDCGKLLSLFKNIPSVTITEEELIACEATDSILKSNVYFVLLNLYFFMIFQINNRIIFSSLITRICCQLQIEYSATEKIIELAFLILKPQDNQIQNEDSQKTLQKIEDSKTFQTPPKNKENNVESEKDKNVNLQKDSSFLNQYSFEVIKEKIQDQEYQDAWNLSNIFQKFTLKIEYSDQLKHFHWPKIKDDKNYIYVKRNHILNKLYYQCQQFRTGKCKAACQVDLKEQSLTFVQQNDKKIDHRYEKDLKFSIENAHTPEGIKRYAKKLALSQPYLSSQAIFNQIMENNKSQNVILPSKCDIQTAVNNIRQYHNFQIKDIESIVNIQTKCKERFGIELNTSLNGRVAHFSSSFQMRRLISENLSQFFIDGYHKTPSGWCQMLSICIRDNESELFFPVYHILMSQKSQCLYEEAFQQAKCIIDKYKTSQNPFQLTTVSCDFEKALLNSIKQVFPQAEIYGCFFHLSQCIWRKAGKLGLRQSQHISTTIYIITSFLLLSFFEVEKVPKIFESIQKRFDIEQFKPLLNYLKEYWIEEKICSLSMINYRRKLVLKEFFSKSNNCIAAYHSVLSRKLQYSISPNINFFLEKVSEIENDKSLQWLNFQRGKIVSNDPTEYSDQYLSKIIERYWMMISRDDLLYDEILRFVGELKQDKLIEITDQLIIEDLKEQENTQINDIKQPEVQQNENLSEIEDSSDIKEIISKQKKIQSKSEEKKKETHWELIKEDRSTTYIKIPKWLPKICDCEEYAVLRIQKENKYIYLSCSNFGKENSCKYFRYIPKFVIPYLTKNYLEEFGKDAIDNITVKAKGQTKVSNKKEENTNVGIKKKNIPSKSNRTKANKKQ